MNYIKITKNDIANGTGVRVVLWVSGCTVHCKGCHNPQTWDFKAGKHFDAVAKAEVLDALSKSWISGLTLSGGHPLEKENISEVLDLIKTVRETLPNKTIWLYTGWELNLNQIKQLSDCDVIVDGAYVEELRDISLKFRGSSNQRIIDVQESIGQEKIILWKF